MAFGIGTNTEVLDCGEIAENLEEVAVKCWFTSTGKAMPLMMKIKTNEEEIITIDDIHVIKSDKQWYAGIYNIKYYCEAMVQGRMLGFILYFCPEECAWKLQIE